MVCLPFRAASPERAERSPHGKNGRRNCGIPFGKGKNAVRYGKFSGNHVRDFFHLPGDQKNLPDDETHFRRNEPRHLRDENHHVRGTAKTSQEMNPVSQETGICFLRDEIRHPGNKKKHLGDGKNLLRGFFVHVHENNEVFFMNQLILNVMYYFLDGLDGFIHSVNGKDTPVILDQSVLMLVYI
jgi:hypothetical protein